MLPIRPNAVPVPIPTRTKQIGLGAGLEGDPKASFPSFTS